MSERKFTYNRGHIESNDPQLKDFSIVHRGKSYGNPTTHWTLTWGDLTVWFTWAEYEHQDDGRVKIVIGNVSSNRNRRVRDKVSGKFRYELDKVSGMPKKTFSSREEQDDIINLFVEAMNAAFESNVNHPSKPRPFKVNTVFSERLQDRLDNGLLYRPRGNKFAQ